MMTERSKIPENVLIVEDEFMLAVVLQDMMEALGVSNVSHAATIDEALALIERGSFEFALLDINLGTDNSLPVARELVRRDIRFVFASGYDAKFDTGGISAPLIRKPLGLDDIRAVLSGDCGLAGTGRIGRTG